ncbi:uncharacterized protein RAG0_08226 [Rhynchosporium agropyri]|uniref:NAD-dependent epimerase/dehydratase domain-containing protein n=1 Tax=Rhynchosporium agropyri TaxID=914238 RepID=A0A1E1KPZ8_9HELO|nr:uncharacterized protein RAG0_08226 [Rhynchosporium agropyri]
MVNVLIIGVTLPIGEALAQSLLRSGNYQVFGFCKDPNDFGMYYRNEVVPILTDNSPGGLKAALDIYFINVVVDARACDKDTLDILPIFEAHRLERLASTHDAGFGIPKLGFVYVGRTGVHGSSLIPLNDLMPVLTSNTPSSPIESSSRRPDLEHALLGSSSYLDVIIMRPAVVYGRASRMLDSIFWSLQLATERNIDIMDDVASGLHAAIDKLPLISGTGVYPIFDLVTSQEKIHEIVVAAAFAMGFLGRINYIGCADTEGADVLNCSGNLSSGRAKTILGWEPKRHGFVRNMEVYVKAWLASREPDLA